MTNSGRLSQYFRRGLSRRNVVRGTMAAGAALGSGLWTPARGDDDNDRRCGQPLPIPHLNPAMGPGALRHFYFPGPVSGGAAPTDPTGVHPEGRDPSTITHFDGVVGQVDLFFSGTGRDTKTGAKAKYGFHTDTRFMRGEFIFSDQQRHRGAFAFI